MQLELPTVSSKKRVLSAGEIGVPLPTAEVVGGQAGVVPPHAGPDDEEVGDLIIQRQAVDAIRALLRQGKHVILTGLPGTGKTTLAYALCDEFEALGWTKEFLPTTATSDWSTFDTIGGYVPSEDGKLSFRPGLFLRALQENRWIVVDEINRADVDKAFGQFLTVLSGKDVELPFNDPDTDEAIRIEITEEDGSKKDGATYYVGRKWRVIGTMNTADRASLYALTGAFVRRMAPCFIPIPQKSVLAQFGAGLGREAQGVLLALIEHSPRALGPAIYKDLAAFLGTSPELAAEGLFSLVLPQYEGVPPNRMVQFYRGIAPSLEEHQRARLAIYLVDFYDLSAASLGVEAQEDETERAATETTE